MSFREPLFLLLLLAVPLVVWRLLAARGAQGALAWGAFAAARAAAGRAAGAKAWVLHGLLLAAYAAAVVGFAGPREGRVFEKRLSEGVDIMVCLDVSGSMLAVDDARVHHAAMRGQYYQDSDGRLTNRLAYAKRFTDEFAARRVDDRLGLVVFGGYAILKCPPTFDHGSLREILAGTRIGDVSVTSTAIGDALGTAVGRLVRSTAASRVVILLTDGANNAGALDPLTAAETARAVGVRVHTIGIGGNTPVMPYAQRSNVYVIPQRGMGWEADDASLRKVAESTGGRFFRADDPRELATVYAAIDALEKTTLEKKVYVEYDDRARPWYAAALLLLLLHAALRHLAFRVRP